MQQIRQVERQAAEIAKLKDQSKPSIKLSPTAKPLEAPGSIVPSDASGVPAGFFQVNAPGNGTVATAIQLPSRIPSVPIPRTEDLMPADALLQRAPTSQLLPTAQSTWSSTSQPLRFLSDQQGLQAAHFFKAPAGAEAAKGAPAESVPAGLGSPGDQNQFEALRLPMKY